jgi:hypothetical protein
MTDGGEQSIIRGRLSAPDRGRPPQPGPGQADLEGRLENLASVLLAFAQETVVARREAARLHSLNEALQRRVNELEARFGRSRDQGSGDV